MQRRDRQSCGAIRANGAFFSRDSTMEDEVIVVVCGYPELYIHLRTFTKTGIHLATRLELPGRSPSHDANSRRLCSEFHARMARISRATEASKLKMFKRPNSR